MVGSGWWMECNRYMVDGGWCVVGGGWWTVGLDDVR